MAKDYYRILELRTDATPEDIKKAYRRLCKIWHPDKNTAENKLEAERRFKDISEAFFILIKDDTRRSYDSGETDFSVGSDLFKSSDELFREMFGQKTLDEAINDFLNDPIFDGIHVEETTEQSEAKISKPQDNGPTQADSDRSNEQANPSAKPPPQQGTEEGFIFSLLSRGKKKFFDNSEKKIEKKDSANGIRLQDVKKYIDEQKDVEEIEEISQYVANHKMKLKTRQSDMEQQKQNKEKQEQQNQQRNQRKQQPLKSCQESQIQQQQQQQLPQHDNQPQDLEQQQALESDCQCNQTDEIDVTDYVTDFDLYQ